MVGVGMPIRSLSGVVGGLVNSAALLASGLTAITAITVFTAPVASAGPSPAPSTTSQLITVNAPSSSSTSATVTAWQRGADGIWRVAIGPTGAMVGGAGIGQASEGSDHTPAGTLALTQAFGRQPNPGTRMPYFQTDTLDWWDENPSSPTYNLHVRQVGSPGGASENLYNSGSVYDYVVNMNYNTARVPGAGSAFFLHVSDGSPTAGCVSVGRASMVAILRWLDPAQHPYISIKVGAAWQPPAPSLPVGGVNTATSTAARHITVVGWAFDSGAAGGTATVRVTVSGPTGASTASVRTSLARPDVARAYSWAGGRTGFSAVVQAEGLGPNLVCVSVVPARAPSRTQSINCRQVLVQNEFGRLDSLPTSGFRITAVGWALNPNNRASHVAIRLFVTGPKSLVIGDVRTSVSRPDVARVYPTYFPNAGFRITFAVPQKGSYVICAMALPEYGSWSAQTLGCHSTIVT